MDSREKVFMAMVAFDKGDPKRVQHFTKVYAYAHLIGMVEGLGEKELEILDLAALVHDIGIIPAEKKYGYNNGKLQEEMGPEYARKLLAEAGVEEAAIQRVEFLVGHHHTYKGVEGLDWQILLEADFLVNAYESELTKAAIEEGVKRFFRTKTGISLCVDMFNL